MANLKHVEQLKQGVAQWNEWRKQYQEIWSDMRYANLHGANLHCANLAGVNLIGINLSRADLSSADLYHANLNQAKLDHTDLFCADLSGADLNAANLSSADLSYANLDRIDLNRANLDHADLRLASLNRADLRLANLSGADLREADLREANLSGANLSGTRMHHAMIDNTTFANVDLRMVRGLVEVSHLGPSIIQLHTVLLPPDGSALHFLRGAGVPDEWIDFWRTTRMHPIQYHSLFISYASQDDIVARRLHADLQAQGVRCWFAPEDMKIGDRFHTRINEAIHVQDKLLLLVSEHALASDWVEIEVRAALEKEQRQRRDVLFPVRLDNSFMETTQAWAAMLRQSRHIGDFTNWTDPQAYQSAFERLLRDLKKADDKPLS